MPRAPEVQERPFLTTNPPQPGAWHWASGAQLWYRPPNYWLPGTIITVRAALAGQPISDGHFGDADRSTAVTVGAKVLIDIDNGIGHRTAEATNAVVIGLPGHNSGRLLPVGNGRRASHDH